MVILEFQPDEVVIAEEIAEDLRTADAAALQETYFILPVRLNVNDVELLEVMVEGEEQVWTNVLGEDGVAPTNQQRHPSPWLPLPVLHVATIGVEAVRKVKQAETSIYTLPGSGWQLRFTISGMEVSIYSSVNRRTANALYDDLLSTFVSFASDVRETLSRQAPELREHPQWGIWFQTGG